jgi:uncharacterized membrane-anchored protein
MADIMTLLNAVMAFLCTTTGIVVGLSTLVVVLAKWVWAAVRMDASFK